MLFRGPFQPVHVHRIQCFLWQALTRVSQYLTTKKPVEQFFNHEQEEQQGLTTGKFLSSTSGKAPVTWRPHGDLWIDTAGRRQKAEGIIQTWHWPKDKVTKVSPALISIAQVLRQFQFHNQSDYCARNSLLRHQSPVTTAVGSTHVTGKALIRFS